MLFRGVRGEDQPASTPASPGNRPRGLKSRLDRGRRPVYSDVLSRTKYQFAI